MDDPPALATPEWAAPAWEIPTLNWKAGRVTVNQEHKGGKNSNKTVAKVIDDQV